MRGGRKSRQGRDLRLAVESRGTGSKRGIALRHRARRAPPFRRNRKEKGQPRSFEAYARRDKSKRRVSHPFKKQKPKGCGTLVTYRPDDVRDWPFLLLSDLKEFKLPPARPYCCAEERLTLISPPKRKSLSAPRN